ncbi:carbohydrate kinase [uncultured Paracoccus sp.]|uniref:carbohydrate kinase family protein n=1 Tax=uncultured Paracoccus sp. TaxID=189685 RepID=UPI0026348757|nr:carbohydrate kinase [uncultured Paracoccus sp.]
MILCAGEALIDLLPAPGGGRRAVPGGSVFNTALGLGRLGHRAGFLWPLSTDAHGRLLHGLLAAAGVDLSPCPVTERPTATAEVTLTGAEARYRFTLTGTTATALTPENLPALPATTQALFIGGISLALDPSGAAIEKLVAQTVAARRPVMLDANLRPAVIGDRAAFRPRLDRLMAQASIIKLSSEDLAWLAPDQPPRATARVIAARGDALVLHTDGARGATLIRRRRVPLHQPAPSVPVVDTVGGGDSFDAGFLSGLQDSGALRDPVAADDATLKEALWRGVQLAAFSVGRAGADPPWRADLPWL